MTDSDRKAFALLLADVCGFYREPTSDFALSVWWEACKPFPLDAIRRAMTAHATDPARGQFCPKPADVIRFLRGSTADEATAAWGRVFSQVSSVGRYSAPKLTESESAALDAIGGWQRLCNSQEDEVGFLSKAFRDAYRVTHEREARQMLLGESAEIERLAGELIGRIAYGATDGE